MNQSEKRLFLIQSLLKERPEYRDMGIPADTNRQRQLLRGLMNIRTPQSIGADFLKTQDEYLQSETAAKGITDIADLTPIQPGLYLWQGDRKQSTIECTRYASVRRILRNSTFSRQAAKCERAVCKQSIASPAENRCNQKMPSTTPLKWCWASFLSCFGAFFEDKTACVPFAFLCHIDTLPSVHRGNCVFLG